MWNWFSLLCVCNLLITLMFLPILLCKEGMSSTEFGLMKGNPSNNQASQIMELKSKQKGIVNHIKKHKKPSALNARINEAFSIKHPFVMNETVRKWFPYIYQQDMEKTSNTTEGNIDHILSNKSNKGNKNYSTTGETHIQLKNPMLSNILSSTVHNKSHTLNTELPQKINIQEYSTISNLTAMLNKVKLRNKRDLNSNFQRTYIVERPRRGQTEQQQVPDLQNIMKSFSIPETLRRNNLLLQKDSEVVFSIKRDTGKSKRLEQNIQETLKAFLRMAENKSNSVNETRNFPSFLNYADIPIEKGILGDDSKELFETDTSMTSRKQNANSLEYGKHYFDGLQYNYFKPQSNYEMKSQPDGTNLNFPTNAILKKLNSNKLSLKKQNQNNLPYNKYILGYATDIIFHKLNYENFPYNEHNAGKYPVTKNIFNQNIDNLSYKEHYKNFMEGNSRKQNFENVPYGDHDIDDIPIPENILQQNFNLQNDRENFIRTTERIFQKENYENMQDTLINVESFPYSKLNAKNSESRMFNQQKHRKFPNINENKLYNANNHQYVPYFTANDRKLSYKPIPVDSEEEEHKTYIINADNPEYSDNSKLSSQILSPFATDAVLGNGITRVWQLEVEPKTVDYSGKLNTEYELENTKDYEGMASRISSETNINSFAENNKIGNEVVFYTHVTDEDHINKTQSTWSVDPNLLRGVAKSTDIYNLTEEILDTFIPVTFTPFDLTPYEEVYGAVWKPLLRNKEKFVKEEMHIGKHPTAKASEIIRNGNHISSDFVEYVRRKKAIDSHQPVMEGKIVRVLTRRRRQIDADKSGKVFSPHNRIYLENQIQDVAFSDCCYNGGTCHSAKTIHGKTSQWCSCPSTFTGLYCEIRVNECLSKPCKENHICINFPKGYSCICAPGFIKEEDDCIPQITCAEFPCLNGGLCEDTKDNLFKCICPLGFLGRTCEIRVPECEDSSCSGNEICIAMETGYRCVKKEEVQS